MVVVVMVRGGGGDQGVHIYVFSESHSKSHINYFKITCKKSKSLLKS